ncbi:MAG: hypothetical protein WC878_00195 [Candidatus Paceibacterota bacterium]|jgi:hypothetical protein
MQEEQPVFNEYPPIKNGEIFDAEKAVRGILKAPKDERRQKLAEFKEKLAFQQVGLARMQDILIDEIRRKPEGKMDDFFDLATEMGAEFGMNDKQKRDIWEALSKYEIQHKAVLKIRKEFPKDKDLFHRLFGSQPKGEIEITTGPVSIYIKCHDFEDYMAVCFHEKRKGSGKKRDFTEEEMMEAEESGAINIYSTAYPNIGWAITAENTEKIKLPGVLDKDSHQKFVHEEQHIIKSFFDKEDRLDPDSPGVQFSVRKNFLAAETEKEKEKILGDFFRMFRHNAEDRAKDEMLAYYKDGRFERIEGLLLISEEEGGIYDFLEEPKKANYLWLKSSDEVRALTKRVKDRVLVDEYKEIIINGTDAIQKMEEAGYEKDEIIALLTHEPLAKWGKVVGRITE